MMRTASLPPTRKPLGSAPAARGPTTLSSTGGSAVSAAWTAKPSIAVLSNGGTSSSASTGVLVTHPSASCRSTARGVSGSHSRRTAACTSSSGVRLTALPRDRGAPAAGLGFLDAVAAVLLGSIEGCVGGSQQLGGGEPV